MGNFGREGSGAPEVSPTGRLAGAPGSRSGGVGRQWRTGVFAGGWYGSPFAQFHERVKDDPAGTVRVAHTGHGVTIAGPEATASQWRQRRAGPGAVRAYSNLIPASLTIFATLSVSVRMRSANCCGVLLFAARPRSASFARTSGIAAMAASS